MDWRTPLLRIMWRDDADIEPMSERFIERFVTIFLTKIAYFEVNGSGVKLRRGLFIGRFQPPHLGHLHAIKQALEECDELIIVIGSSQYSHTFENPFTAGERFEMIRLMLKDGGVDLSKVIIIPVPDVGEHSLWVSRIESYCPRFDVIYTNNPLVQRLFKEAGYEVKELKLYRREVEMGTIIRKKIINGDLWEDFVSKSVAEYLKKSGMVQRLKEIFGRSDKS